MDLGKIEVEFEEATLIEGTYVEVSVYLCDRHSEDVSIGRFSHDLGDYDYFDSTLVGAYCDTNACNESATKVFLLKCEI